MIQTRYLAVGGMAAYDLAALRFAFAGLFLFPVVARKGLIFRGGTFAKGMMLALSLGFLYMVIVATGMRFAPTSHAAAVVNGAMVLSSALLSVILLSERLSPLRAIGLIVLIAGLGLLIGIDLTQLNIGHLFFLLGGALWGFYSVLIKKWSVDPLHATAIVGVYSAIFYLPFYLVFLKAPNALPPMQLLFHGIYQGGLASGVALYLFSYGVAALGAARASLYMPMIPVLTTVLAIFLLAEIPGPREIGSIVLIVIGFTFAVMRPKKTQSSIAR